MTRDRIAALEWKRPELKSGYPHECYRARSGDREYWLRSHSSGWRLLVFDTAGYAGAANHHDLETAKQAAERREVEFVWEDKPHG
jgi:hypothetical protein